MPAGFDTPSTFVDKRKADYLGIASSGLMGLAFCSTAAVYVDTDYNLTDQVVSIVAVWVSLIVSALLNKSTNSHSVSKNNYMRSLWLLLLVASLTIFPLSRTTNFTSTNDQFYTVGYSFAVFLTIAVFLWHAWVSGVGLLLRGFLAASIFGPIGYIALAYLQGNLAELASIEKRFSTAGMHPNLLGFCCAGFACISLSGYFLSRSKWRWLLLVPSLLSLATVYLASSRGSLVGVLVGMLTVIAILLIRLMCSAVTGSFEARTKLLALFIVSIFGVSLAAFSADEFLRSEMFAIVADRLAIFNEYRGLSTGLTGRWDTWRWIINQYSATDFWLGVGPRKSGIIAGDIDNGYIVLLLENGLLAGVIIIFRFVGVTIGFLWKALTTRDDLEFRLSTMLALVCVTFLTNNLVARFLFGIGNPFCLLSLAIFALGADFQRLGIKYFQGLGLGQRPDARRK